MFYMRVRDKENKNLRDEEGENHPFYLVIAIWPQKSGKLGQRCNMSRTVVPRA